MANIALSEAEKIFILHGVEVITKAVLTNAETNLNLISAIGRFSCRWAFLS